MFTDTSWVLLVNKHLKMTTAVVKNVSHCQQQQSYSAGLRSPGRSNSTYFWNDSWVQTFNKQLWFMDKWKEWLPSPLHVSVICLLQTLEFCNKSSPFSCTRCSCEYVWLRHYYYLLLLPLNKRKMKQSLPLVFHAPLNQTQIFLRRWLWTSLCILS